MAAVIADVARHLGDDERRARLARRHGVAAEHRYTDVTAASVAMVGWHATEAATVPLALAARVRAIGTADVDRALYDDRSLVKQLAMRRTLWAFPRDLLPAVWGSAAARVADAEGRRLRKDVAAAGLAADPDAWVRAAREAVLARLADGTPLSASRIREDVPEVAGQVTVGTPGKKWGGEVPVGPRVLTLLGAEGWIVRAGNAGHWRLNKPTWTTVGAWLGESPESWPAEVGYAALVRRWLWAFGPGTEADLVWWLGATKTIVRTALVEVGAVAVALDGGVVGWVLPDDVDPVPEPEPWAALLPVLDPTTMGWKERGFYLDADHTPYLFDSNGNAGTTAWWCGRIVGCWVQDENGAVRVVLRDDPGPDARAALDAEAERLTTWLDGVRITSVYASRQMRGAVLS